MRSGFAAKRRNIGGFRRRGAALRHYAWGVLALAGSGGCTFEDPEVSSIVLEATVGEQVDATCTTSVVRALSLQIAAEVNCVAPGSLVEFEPSPGVVFNSGAVLPFLHPGARDDLLMAVFADGGEVRINSGFRTVAQQYMLSQWELQGRCGIAVAAAPGRSNHESGRALDLANYGEWSSKISAYGWVQTVLPSDPVHFDHLDSPDNRGLDVLAFQRLWNRNNPGDTLEEDGIYGGETGARLQIAPAEGFSIAGCGNDRYLATTVRITSPGSVRAGDHATVVVEIRNTGLVAWEPGEVSLVTAIPARRESELYDEATWESPDAVMTLDVRVAPDEVASFAFDVFGAPWLDGQFVSEAFSLREQTTETYFGDVLIEMTVGNGDWPDSGDPDHLANLSGGCATGRAGGAPWSLIVLLGLLIRRCRRRFA